MDRPDLLELDFPLTLEQALLLDPSDLQELTRGDVTFDPVALERTVGRWLALRDVSPTDLGSASRVRREVEGDTELLVALNLPATEFLTWLRTQPWESFDGVFAEIDEDAPDSERQRDSVLWAVLDRVRSAVSELGPLAGQQPLPMIWAGSASVGLAP